MNIFFLTTHLNTGGISSYLLTLSQGLVSRGHRVVIGSSGGNLVDGLKTFGVEHLKLNIRTKSELNPRIYLAGHQLKYFLRSEKINIIHANTRITQVMGELLSRTTDAAYVSTCHGFFNPKWSRRVFPAWGQFAIAISEPVAQHLVKDLGVSPEKVVVIRNGLDAGQFPLITSESRRKIRQEFQLGPEPTIGIIARLSDVKGHSVLIDAMKKIVEEMPSAKLLIVGEGPLESSLKQKVSELGLEKNVLFYPVVNQTLKMLSLFDCFVMPSLQEGLGLSVMEAQLSGLSVVASKVGGIPSLIQDGETGLLVPPGNPKILAEAVLLFLRHPERGKEMGEKAREFIQKEFSADRMVEQTFALYEKAVKLKNA